MHGYEAATRSRDKDVPGRLERVADVAVNAAGGQLAGGYAGCADFALWCPGVVLERMQRKHTLRSDEQGGKKQAWQ